MPALLLGEPLAQRLHQLVPAAQRLDLRLLLRRQIALAERPQPFVGQFGLRVGRRLDAVEAFAEHAVEAVEVALVLDEGRARQEVEFVDVEAATPARIASNSVRNSRKLAGTFAARSSRKKEMNTGFAYGAGDEGWSF